MDRLNYFSLLTPASGMPAKRRCVAQTCVMLEPWVAVATTCKTKCNQFARVNLPTSSRAVARNPASKGSKSVDTACGYGACDPHNSATKTGISAKGYACRIPSIFQANKGANTMKHISNYIETHAWTWYAIAAIWATILGSAI